MIKGTEIKWKPGKVSRLMAFDLTTISVSLSSLFFFFSSRSFLLCLPAPSPSLPVLLPSPPIFLPSLPPFSSKNITEKSVAESKGRKRGHEDIGSFFLWFCDLDPSSDEPAELIKDDIWPNPLQFYLVSWSFFFTLCFDYQYIHTKCYYLIAFLHWALLFSIRKLVHSFVRMPENALPRLYPLCTDTHTLTCVLIS